ncbi:hypothetical protein FOA52_014360 [Chlamydomonas sp. UWO 241]|nr:hypothetical protein FOA52_014360 [Chlamydomonas sp. UWO 241]
MADQVELGDDLEASLLSHASSESQRDTIARQLALLRSQQAALASCTDLQARLVAKVEEARMASTSSAHASAHAAAAVEEQQDRASTDPPIGSGPPSGKPGPEHAAGSGVANAPARPGAAHEADVVPQREQERPEQGQQLLPPPPPLPSPFPEGASAEEVCSSVYSLLDNPGASEERGLAALSASSTGAVKQRFRQMREAMRGLLSRVGRRKRSGAWAGAPDGGEDDAVVAGGDRGGTGGDAGAGPSTSAAPAPAGASLGSVEEHRRQQQLVKLRDLLTGDGGGLRATGGGGAGPRGAGARSAPGGDPGGLLVVQMAVTSSYEVRSAQLSALLATKSVQLYRLVSPRLLETLGAWLQEAEADGQVGMM